MPSAFASPAIQLSADGVTWLAPGAPLQVAANAAFYARLNSTANVDSTTWEVISTDDVGTAPALTPSGLNNSLVTGSASGAGTAFILQSTINAGTDRTTNSSNPLTTSATAKVWVPAANGGQVVCFDEHAEAGPEWWMPLFNFAVRAAPGAGYAASSTTISTTAPLTGGGDLTTNRTFAINPATDSTAGSMSAADKTKLDGIPAVTTFPPQTTSNAGTATLFSVPISPGTSGRLRAVVEGVVTRANASTTGLFACYEFVYFYYFNAGGALELQVGLNAQSSMQLGPTFGAAGPPAADATTPFAVSSSIVLTVKGTTAPPAYANSTAVVPQSQGGTGIGIIQSGTGLYVVTTGGTTASSGAGPSGTGTGIAEGGGSPVIYDYLGLASAGVTITWTVKLFELL